MTDTTATRPRKQRKYPADEPKPVDAVHTEEEIAAAKEAAQLEAVEAPAKPKRLRPERETKTKTLKENTPEEQPEKPAVMVVDIPGSPIKVVRPEGEKERYVFELVHDGDTKNYAKFKMPLGSGCVGTVYAPLSTGRVRVSLEAAD